MNMSSAADTFRDSAVQVNRSGRPENRGQG